MNVWEGRMYWSMYFKICEKNFCVYPLTVTISKFNKGRFYKNNRFVIFLKVWKAC